MQNIYFIIIIWSNQLILFRFSQTINPKNFKKDKNQLDYTV